MISKILRVILFIILIIGPVIFYKSLNKKDSEYARALSLVQGKDNANLPLVALIFDDLGESLRDLKEIYSLDTPLTISVVPKLKFSKNIAHIGSRCGFSVLIHLPMQPSNEKLYRSDKYKFISSDLNRREVEFLMRRYLNSIKIAIGVNNHMGSKATEDPNLMRHVLGVVKRKNLIFIDSRTSLKSVAYKIAREENLVCGYNEGFLDAVDDVSEIKKRMDELIVKAKDKGKIIVIAHPRKNTLNFLKDNLASLKEEVKFITIEDYFEL